MSILACVEEFGKCYIIRNDKDIGRLTHIEAEERCRQQQEALVTLGSKEEENFLKYLVREEMYRAPLYELVDIDFIGYAYIGSDN